MPNHSFSSSSGLHSIDLVPVDGGVRVRTSDGEIAVSVEEAGAGSLRLTFPGRTVTAHVAVAGDTRWIAIGGRTFELSLQQAQRRGGQPGADTPGGLLRAPMPGQVRSVNTAAGDAVKDGQTLLILEAMKMEIRIQAPGDGVVAALHVAAGEQVQQGQALVEIRPGGA